MALVLDLNDKTYQKKFSKSVSLSSKNTDGLVTISNDIAGQISSERVGNNVVIKVYGIKDGAVTTDVLGTVTIKNFGLKEVVEADNVKLVTDNNDTTNFIKPYTLGTPGATKKVKITGTYLDETIYGSTQNDVIYGVGGTNTIYAGGGDDKVYGGEGVDNFVIAKGDATIKKTVDGNLVDVRGAKGDTIYGAKAGDKLVFSTPDVGSNAIEFSKVGNNFVVDATFASDGKTVERATLTDFFKDADRIQDIEIAGHTYKFGDKVLIDGYEFYNPIIDVTGNLNKNNTLVGTQYGDTITGGKKADKITTGAGNDKIYLKGGKDTVDIDGDGKKTLVFEGNQEVTVNIKNSDAIVVLSSDFHSSDRIKSNDDLIVTFKTNDNEFRKVTIKDYFKADGNKNIKWIVSGSEADIMNSYYSQVHLNGETNKANKLDGSDFGDYIRGGNKKDIITTGDATSYGDDIVAGKGDDEIIINGKGNKFIAIGNGDGHDTVSWDKNGKSSFGKAYMKYSGEDVLSYTKSEDNKDLIITRTYDSGKTIKSEKTTIKDYFVDDEHGSLWFINSDYAGKYINASYESDEVIKYNTYQGVSNRANTVDLTVDKLVINDTEYKDGGYKDILFLGGSKKDVITTSLNNTAIFSGAGDDVITVSGAKSEIHAGVGNDTVNINTAGDVLYFYSGGKDTVNFDKTANEVLIDCNTGGEDYKYLAGQITGKYGYKKDGDNLVFSTLDSSGKLGTITLTDYFKEGNYNPETIKIGKSSKYSLSDELSEGVWAEGVYDAETKTTTYTSVNNYRLLYNYKGTGRVVLNGTTSDYGDRTMATLGNKSDLTINSAEGGSNDELWLTADYKNLKTFFNVNADGEVECTTADTDTDNFLLFNKKSLTVSNIQNTLDGKSASGVININNFFAEESDENEGKGAGYLKRFYISKNMESTLSKLGTASGYKTLGTVNLGSWIDSVAEEVGKWLTTNGYGTSMDVLNNSRGKTDAESAADITAMLKVYQNVQCDATFYGG